MSGAHNYRFAPFAVFSMFLIGFPLVVVINQLYSTWLVGMPPRGCVVYLRGPVKGGL